VLLLHTYPIDGYTSPTNGHTSPAHTYHQSADRHAYTESTDSNSTQAFTLATSAEEIVGTWVVGSYYLRFDKDGTFRQADALQQLEDQPYAISSYQFRGDENDHNRSLGFRRSTCGKKIGSYEIRLLESGNIRIVAIQINVHQERVISHESMNQSARCTILMAICFGW